MVIAVERTLLSVAPAAQGWSVNLNHLLIDLQPTRYAAIDAANAHAYKRYVVTGRPTGVTMSLCDGESVLVSQNG